MSSTSTTGTAPPPYLSIEAARIAGNGYFKAGDLDAAVAAYTRGMLDLYPASLLACSIPGVVHCEKQLGLISEDDVALLYNAPTPSTPAEGKEGEAESAIPTINGILTASSLVQSTTSSAAMRPLELLEEFNKCCGNACMSLYKKGNINPAITTSTTTATIQEQIVASMNVVDRESVSILKSMEKLADTHLPKKTSTSVLPPLSTFIEEVVVITTAIAKHSQSSPSSPLPCILLQIVCAVLNININHVGVEDARSIPVGARVDCVQLAATGILENPFLAKAHAFLGAAAGEVLALAVSILVLINLLPTPVPSSSPVDTSMMRRALMVQAVNPVITRVFRDLLNLSDVDISQMLEDTLSSSSSSSLTSTLQLLLQGHFVRSLNTAHQHLSIAMTLLPELVPQPTPTPTTTSTADSGLFKAYLTPFDGDVDQQLSTTSATIGATSSELLHFPFTGNVAKGMLIIRLASTLCQLASSSTQQQVGGVVPEVVVDGGVVEHIEPPFVIAGLVSSSLHSLSGNGVVFSPPTPSSTSSTSLSVLPAGKVVAELVFPDSISSYLDPDIILDLDRVAVDDERVATSLCQCCGISLSDAVVRKKNAGVKVVSTDEDDNHIWGCMACRMVAFCSMDCISKYNTASTSSSTSPPADRHTLFECARYRKLREMFRQITEGNDRFAQGAGGRQTDVPDNFLDVASHTISTLSAIEAEAEEEKRQLLQTNKSSTEGGARRKRKLLEALEGHDAEVAQSTLPLVPLICQLLNASKGDGGGDASSSSFPVSEATIAHIVGVVLCNSMEVLNEEEEDEQQHVAASTASSDEQQSSSVALTSTMPPFLKPLRQLTKSIFDNPDAFGGKGIACGQVLFLNALSHLNHSCRPNCATTTTTTTSGNTSSKIAASSKIVKKCVQTLRPIFPGEELTISYIPTLYAAPKRRSELLTERFYFTCRCPACSGSTTSSSLKNIGNNNSTTTTAELTTRGGISWSHVFAAAAISHEKSMQGSDGAKSTNSNVAVGTLLARMVASSSSPTLLELLLTSSSSQHKQLLLVFLKALTSTAASTLPPLPTTSQTARLKKSHEVARQDTISVSYITASWAAAQTTTTTTPTSTVGDHFIVNDITNKYYSLTDLYQTLSSAEKPPANTNNHRPPGERTTLYFNRAQVLCSGIRERSVQEILEDPTFFKKTSESTKKSVINAIVPLGMRTVLVELTSFRTELNRHLHPYNHAVQDVRNTTTFALSVLSSHILSLARREIVDVIAKARMPPSTSESSSTPTTPAEYIGASNVVAYVAAACIVTTSAVLSTLNELLLWSCLTPDATFPVKLDKRQNVVHAQAEITQLLMEVGVMCKELDTVSSSSPGCSKEVIAGLLQSDPAIQQTLQEVYKAVGTSIEVEDGLGVGGSSQLPSLSLIKWLLSS